MHSKTRHKIHNNTCKKTRNETGTSVLSNVKLNKMNLTKQFNVTAPTRPKNNKCTRPDTHEQTPQRASDRSPKFLKFHQPIKFETKLFQKNAVQPLVEK